MINWESPGNGAYADIYFPSTIKRGDVTNVYIKANYTGTFVIYADTGGAELHEVLNQTGDHSAGSSYKITIPSNATKLSFRTFQAGVIVEDLHFFEYTSKHKTIKTNWWGKEFLCYGDSISALNNSVKFPPYPLDDQWPYSWAAMTAVILGFKRVRGRGVGGSTCAFTDDPWYWYANSEGEYVGDDDNPQPPGTTAHLQFHSSWSRLSVMIPNDYNGLITLMPGVNDWASNVEIETERPVWVNGSTVDTDWGSSPKYLGGDFDVTKFKGAVASMIMKTQILAPNANIVVLTPISGRQNESGSPFDQMANGSGKTILDFANAVKEVAQFMSVPCIDIFGTTGINQINRGSYIADVVHPYTVNGRNAIARAIVSGLLGIYPNFWNDISIDPGPIIGQGYWIDYNTEVQTNFDGTSEWISGTTFNQPSWRTQAKEVFIPEGIIETGTGVFSGSTYLEKVTLPSTITTMSTNQFSDCTALLDLTVLATAPPAVGSFGSNIGGPNTKIYVPSGSVDVYKAAQGWSAFSAVIFAIPDPEPGEYGYWIHYDTLQKYNFEAGVEPY